MNLTSNILRVVDKQVWVNRIKQSKYFKIWTHLTFSNYLKTNRKLITMWLILLHQNLIKVLTLRSIFNKTLNKKHLIEINSIRIYFNSYKETKLNYKRVFKQRYLYHNRLHNKLISNNYKKTKIMIIKNKKYKKLLNKLF
jgi:hypothetical protein